MVQLVESWVYNPEDTGSNPRAGGKKHHKYSSPPADPSVKWVPGLVLGRQSSLAVVMYNRRSMWAHVHASCCDHSWMLLQDAWPGFRRYHHASTGPRTCLVHRNPGTYVSILTAGSASPLAHSWCGINLHIHGVELLLRRVAGKLCLCLCCVCVGE